jgi:hypothetical protein
VQLGARPREGGVKQSVIVVSNSANALICRSNHSTAFGRPQSAQLMPVRNFFTPSFRNHSTADSSR